MQFLIAPPILVHFIKDFMHVHEIVYRKRSITQLMILAEWRLAYAGPPEKPVDVGTFDRIDVHFPDGSKRERLAFKKLPKVSL